MLVCVLAREGRLPSKSHPSAQPPSLSELCSHGSLLGSWASPVPLTLQGLRHISPVPGTLPDSGHLRDSATIHLSALGSPWTPLGSCFLIWKEKTRHNLCALWFLGRTKWDHDKEHNSRSGSGACRGVDSSYYCCSLLSVLGGCHPPFYSLFCFSPHKELALATSSLPPKIRPSLPTHPTFPLLY